MASTADRTTGIDDRLEIENAALKRRVELLEAELADQAKQANQAVAEAQDRAYWLDRWQIDLNALMERPAAMKLRAVMRALRTVVRRLAQLRRAVLGR